MTVITKPLSDLRSPEKNIRRHTEKQMKEYIRSLEMFGQIKPIIIDETGEIIAGNGLYEALLRMGAEWCECCIIPGLSDPQKKKLMLADNRVYELGITDMDIFDEIIKELDGDIDIPGWDADLIEMMNASVPDVDDMVGSYGIYDQQEVESVNRRQREDHAILSQERLQPAQPPVPQMPNMSTLTAEAPPTEAHSAVQTNPPSAETEDSSHSRYIICPKCGERICL